MERKPAVKTLYLLRHAKAESQSPSGDAGRKLTKRGRKAADAIAAFLGSLAPAPALVLCSPAIRTRETLERVVPALPRRPLIAYEDEIYLAEPAALLRLLRETPESIASVLLIGHNPGLHELAMRLVADPGPLAAEFPTAALAVLRIEGQWAGLRWRGAMLSLFQAPEALSRDPAPPSA